MGRGTVVCVRAQYSLCGHSADSMYSNATMLIDLVETNARTRHADDWPYPHRTIYLSVCILKNKCMYELMVRVQKTHVPTHLMCIIHGHVSW